jgi:hypothetical protein
LNISVMNMTCVLNVYWRPDFARAVLRANHQIAKKNTVTAMINRAYPGASPTDRKTRM